MSAHNIHPMHTHSLEAYRELRLSLPARKSEILGAVRRLGTATDRGIAAWLDYADLNQVRPRVTELIAAGLLVELKATRCPVTGKTVRVVALPVSGVAA